MYFFFVKSVIQKFKGTKCRELVWYNGSPTPTHRRSGVRFPFGMYICMYLYKYLITNMLPVLLASMTRKAREAVIPGCHHKQLIAIVTHSVGRNKLTTFLYFTS